MNKHISVCLHVPGHQGRHRGDSTDDVEEGRAQLSRLHPQQVGGVAADGAEGAEEQHKGEVGSSAEKQDESVNPRLQHRNTQLVQIRFWSHCPLQELLWFHRS